LKNLLARLLLIIVVAMLPAFGFQVYSESADRQIRRQLVEDEALRLMRLVNSELRQVVEGAEQVLGAISGAPTVQDNIPDGCQRLLANLLRQSPRYSTAGVIGLDGRLVCSSFSSAPAIDLSDRAFFRQALGTGEFVIGDYVVDPLSGKPSIQMAKPFTNRDGIVAGVTYVALNIDWLGKQLDSIALPAGSSSTITDRNGTILASYPDGAGFVGVAMPEANRFALGGSIARVATLISPLGRRLIGAYSPVEAAPKGLYLDVGLDQDTTFAAVTQKNITQLVLIAAGIGLTLAMTVLVGTFLIRRPVNRLLLTADRWRTGDLAARTGLSEDGSEFGRLAAAFDAMASAQQVREQALRQSEDHFRATFEQAAVGMAETDLDGRWLRVNDKFCAIIGYTRDEMLARTFRDVTHPDDLGETLFNQTALRAGETKTLNREKRYVRKDGQVVWVNLGVSVLWGSEGRPNGFISVIEDISERKRAETELRGLTEGLESRVQEEIKAREDAQLRAAQTERLHALGQLAGGIAHDFNNVLQAVEGAATLIQRRAGDQAAVRRFAGHVINAAGRGASITSRLLAFSRRGDLRTDALDVAAVLTGLHEILAHALGSTIDVVIEPGDNLPRLLADQGQLETALVNLATNARDAMPDGGQLTFAADAEIVAMEGPEHPAGLAPGRYIRISVADTGFGMDAATLARAEDPFFTTKAVGSGTGLGLPMVRGFAGQSGGGLNIESRPGKGTTIILWLPEAAPSSTPAGESEAATLKAPSPTAARVLVVDDDDIVRDVVAEQLKELGFAVSVASSGIEAMAVLAEPATVDVLVTDLSMPGMDGLALIRGAQARMPGLPAILLTGYAGDGASVAVGGAVTGPFMLLRKPTRATELGDQIHTMLAVGSNRD
jgi:PAS domain S-box-containing protein